MRTSHLERRSRRTPVRQYLSDSHDDRKTMAELKANMEAHRLRRESERGEADVMLLAIDPATPWDFSKSPLEQPEVSPLEPANLGYQFIAESDFAAMERLNGCVMDMLARKLSPDTDFRHMWDLRFADGCSLLRSKFTDFVHDGPSIKQ